MLIFLKNALYIFYRNFLSSGDTKKKKGILIYSCFCYISEIPCIIFSLVLELHNQVYVNGSSYVHLWHAAMHIWSVLWSLGEKSWHDCNTDLLSIFWHDKVCPVIERTYKAESLAIIQFHPFLFETHQGLVL